MIGFNQGNKVLVTNGDQGMFDDGAAVFTNVNGKYTLAVPAGQFFAMDTKTLLSVDETTTSFPNPIKIGVAQANGQPRWLTGEEFYPKNLEAITVKKPTCGSPEVVDLTWSCTQCSEYYGILLRVRDNDTMSWSGYKLGDETFFADARVDCSSACGECNPSETCEAVQDELIEALNNELQAVDKKAFATKLYASSQVFCFHADNDLSCNLSCPEYEGIHSITLDDSENQREIEIADAFTPTTTIPTTMAGLVDILQDVADAMNADTDFEGSAYVTSGFEGANCCVQLHINSELPVHLYISGGGIPEEYTACTTPVNTDLTNKCGIRVIGAPIEAMTSCTLVKQLGYYARNIDLFATTPSFTDATITKVSTATMPQLFGNYVKWQEYEQVIGGQNRKYSGTNNRLNDGVGYNLDANSRLLNAITYADASKSYVCFSVEGSYPHSSPTAGHVLNPYPFTGDIYVPECDSTTLTAVQAFLNKLGDVTGMIDINMSGGVFESGDNII